MITVEKSDPRSAESCRVIEKLSFALASITGDSGKSNFTLASVMEDRALWALARDHEGNVTGCGAFRPLTENIAELKRMYSDHSHPGIGHALLIFLESTAKRMGYSELWLETRQVNRKAINFYMKNGYTRIKNYGPYAGRQDAACFAKSLR